MAYESPVHVYTTEIQHKMAEECDRIVLSEIKNVGVYVEKDELIKALEYDRGQYQKGFRDGRLSVERKTGMWIGEGDGYADGSMVYDMWSCGCCGTRFDEWEEEPDWKYCPVCGSYNGGDEEDV